VEKRSIYYKHLLPVLRVNDAKVALDLSGVVLVKYALKDKGEAQLQLSGEGEVLKPLTDPGSGQTKDPVLVTWEEIIQQANLPFEGQELDAVEHFVEGVRRELVKNEDLRDQAKANSRTQFNVMLIAKNAIQAVVPRTIMATATARKTIPIGRNAVPPYGIDPCGLPLVVTTVLYRTVVETGVRKNRQPLLGLYSPTSAVNRNVSPSAT
jgi:hypothetical protein